MGKGYNQIIELEYLDKLTSNNNAFLIPILQYLCNELNNDNTLKRKYFFEIIEYGFLGTYPVIGIKHLSNQSEDLHDLVENKFISFIQSKSMQEFIDFTIHNNNEIIKTLDRFEKKNKL